MKKHKTKKLSYVLGNKFFPVVSIATFAVVGTIIVAFSQAAVDKNNPIGSADYCKLEGSTTAIYGWAHDGNSGSGQTPKVRVVAGSKSVEVWTNLPSGKDAAINANLANQGIATGSNYGFKAAFSGIYKGSAPTVSGTIFNY